ncbi:putative bifunctional diguanylate cyclase/phosphodiesterase [Brevibacillus migulae]|uniref:putative bifunctional diguanylate cyclase/phosphodiesterase n=1 Tax=Brevibacillus migulae TaxID=1644114 RepID=UPI0014311A42|nr:EAL domain-containing protein [Brevibacillus migulae]
MDRAEIALMAIAFISCTLLILGIALIVMYVERKKAYQQAKRNFNQYRSLFAYNPDIVLQLDRTGMIIEANLAYEKITGWSQNLKKSIIDFLPAHDAKIVENHLAAVSQGEVRHYETVLIGEGSRHIHVQVSNVPIMLEKEITGIYWIASDITERKKAEETIQHMAYHDELTGIPNPRMFQKRLEEALAEAKEKQTELAIFFIDLDRFTMINDRFGHIFGDRVIKVLSKRLQACLAEGELIARLGGDEFAFLLPTVTDHSQISAFSEKVLKQFEQALIVDEMEFHLTPTMGIAVFPQDGEDVESLTKHADKAMFRAKELGNERVQFFNREMEDDGFQQFQLENALRKALEHKELVNYYQPKVDIHTNQIVGMEALIRWIKPDGTMVSPADFIPVAEETGLILPIGKHVLREACMQNKKWHDEGKPPLIVSVNISYVQFRQPDFLDTIREVLEESKLPPQYLELEITEGIAMYDIPSVIQTLRELQQLGIKISIDDFGTGYSSLAYLSQFPIQALKIDKTFIQGAENNPTNQAIILAIMAMAKSLGINIIAEGVEESKQLSFLREHGCHVVQGYYFSPPISPQKFEDFLATFLAGYHR